MLRSCHCQRMALKETGHHTTGWKEGEKQDKATEKERSRPGGVGGGVKVLGTVLFSSLRCVDTCLESITITTDG